MEKNIWFNVNCNLKELITDFGIYHIYRLLHDYNTWGLSCDDAKLFMGSEYECYCECERDFLERIRKNMSKSNMNWINVNINRIESGMYSLRRTTISPKPSKHIKVPDIWTAKLKFNGEKLFEGVLSQCKLKCEEHLNDLSTNQNQL